MKWKKEKDEVLYQQGNKPVLIDAVDMESLKQIACGNQPQIFKKDTIFHEVTKGPFEK